MSQEKVDYKKSLKKDRKKLNQQKKMKSILTTVIAVVIVVAVVGWIGYSLHNKNLEASSDGAAVKTAVDLSHISDYLSDINAEK